MADQIHWIRPLSDFFVEVLVIQKVEKLLLIDDLYIQLPGLFQLGTGIFAT